MQIAILSPGEMGAAVGAALREVGHEVCWRPAGRGPDTRRRAEQAGLVERPDLDGCDVVVSICPPAAALATARSVGGFAGVYVDANAVSPATASAVRDIVTASGATYVDGGIIGPPPSATGGPRFYVSGPGASQVAGLFAGAVVAARVLEGGLFAASSLKMTYAAWTKIGSALLLAASATAGELGVLEALTEEWALSQPDVHARLARAEGAAVAKGWRWQDEMRQIAETFAAAGQPDGFGVAATEVFGHFPRPA